MAKQILSPAGRVSRIDGKLLGTYEVVYDQLARLRIQHRDLLVARVQITPYNLHVLGSFLRALVRLSAPSLLGPNGSDTVI